MGGYLTEYQREKRFIMKTVKKWNRMPREAKKKKIN